MVALRLAIQSFVVSSSPRDRVINLCQNALSKERAFILTKIHFMLVCKKFL